MTPAPETPATSGEARNPKLFRSRWALPTFAFLALFVASSITGVVLGFHGTLDLDHYYLLRAHAGVGNAGLLLLILLSAVHVRALYGSTAMKLVLLVFLFTFGMTFTDFGPLERFFVPLLVLLYVTLRHLLPARKTAALPLWIGVAAFCLLTMTYGTGWSIAGWSRNQRSNMAAYIHDVCGWLAPALVLFHLFWGFDFRAHPRARVAALVVALFVALVIAGALHNPKIARENARQTEVENGRAGRFLSDEDTCGTPLCHSEIWKQWSVSSHRFSSLNVPYQRVAELIEEERGPEGRKTCHGCHEPAVPPGRAQPEGGGGRYAYASEEQGVTCRACHLVTHVDRPARNGRYEFGPEPLYLPDGDLSNSYILGLYLDFIGLKARDHRATYTRDLHRDPAFCETCHRIEISAQSNGASTFVFDGPTPTWAVSSFAQQGVRCVHCHLQLFEFPDPDSNEKDYHARPDHRFLGIHAYLGDTLPPNPIPKPLWDGFRDATKGWLAGALQVSSFEQTFLFYTRDGRSPSYRAFTGQPALDLRIEGARDGDEAVVTVHTANQRIGHRFPVSLLDMSDVWLEVEVTDRDSGPVFASGALDAAGDVPPDAHRLGADVVDKDGEPIRFHRIWVAAGMRNERFVYPGETIRDEYRFPARTLTGLLEVRARWLYRRYDRDFAEWTWGAGTRAPLLEVAAASATLPLAPAPPGAAP